MNNFVRHKLFDILKENGLEVSSDSKRCKAFLADYCPGNNKEIFVLTQAIEQKIVTDLIEAAKGNPDSPLFNMLILKLPKRLEDNLALDKKASTWSVETWAHALSSVFQEPSQGIKFLALLNWKIQKEPDNANLYYYRKGIYEFSGETTLSRRDLEKAAELGHSRAKTELDDLLNQERLTRLKSNAGSELECPRVISIEKQILAPEPRSQDINNKIEFSKQENQINSKYPNTGRKIEGTITDKNVNNNQEKSRLPLIYAADQNRAEKKRKEKEKFQAEQISLKTKIQEEEEKNKAEQIILQTIINSLSARLEKSEYPESIDSIIQEAKELSGKKTSSPEIQLLLATAYFKKGLFFKKTGKYESAVNDLTAAIIFKPAKAALFYNRGLCLLNLDKYTEAQSDIRRASELEPGKKVYLASYNWVQGLVLFHRRNYKNALNYFHKALLIDNKISEFFFYIGLCHYYLNNHFAAIDSFTGAIQINPKNAKYCCWKGKAYKKTGRIEDAGLFFIKAAKLGSAIGKKGCDRIEDTPKNFFEICYACPLSN